MYLKGRKQNAELHYQEGEQENSIQMYLGNSVVKRREIHLGAAMNRSPSHGQDYSSRLLGATSAT